MPRKDASADEGPIVVDSQTGVRRLLFIELLLARFDATTSQLTEYQILASFGWARLN